MKQKSLVKNAMFNFMYTGLNLLFPLVTAPYISRTLGADNLGKVNFATSIVNWFILFAVFGVASYGVREVAKSRDNKKELSTVFSELIIINGILSLFVTVIYFIIIFNVNKFSENLMLYIIMSLSIILNIFSIDWFYQGIEEYSYITIRSAIFKLISLICIFIFINKETDYVIYGLISVLSTSLSGVLNYIYSRKYVKIKIRKINPFKHLKDLKVFFVYSLILNTYLNFDQTLLGFLSSSSSVAFMNRSRAVTGMASAFSTAISNVTLPRSSYYLKNDKTKFEALSNVVPKFILWITIPMAVGCILLSSNIMFILGGKDFLEATMLLQLISVTIVFSPLSGYLQNQILIPTANENYGLICVTISSVISLILNILLIPLIGFMGSGVAILVAEFSAVATRYFIIKRKLNFKKISFFNRSLLNYIISSLVMGAAVYFVTKLISNLYVSFIVGALLGILVYFILLFILKEEVTISVWRKLKKRVLY